MKCIVEDCNQHKIKARNLCDKHYRRWLRYGDPLTLKGTPGGEASKFFHEEVLPYKGEDCLWWPYGRNSGGYGEISVNDKMRGAHVVVCEIVNGPRPSDNHVASHKCGNGHLGCVTPKHLKWQTCAEDEADKMTHGTSNRGSQNGSSVLIDKDVLEIRSLDGKLSRKEIAKRFGVSQTSVSEIISRRRWAWLE